MSRRAVALVGRAGGLGAPTGNVLLNERNTQFRLLIGLIGCSERHLKLSERAANALSGQHQLQVGNTRRWSVVKGADDGAVSFWKGSR